MQKISSAFLSVNIGVALIILIVGLAIIIYVARRVAVIKTCLKEGNQCYWQAQKAADSVARQAAYDEMLAHYAKAIKLGSAEAITRMGHVYKEGWGVEPDMQKAFQYYQKGARKSLHEAQYFLSLLYESGQGVEQNPKKAKYWRKRSQAARFRVGF